MYPPPRTCNKTTRAAAARPALALLTALGLGLSLLPTHADAQTYTVTAAATNGSVTQATQTVAAGNSAIISATANAGHFLFSVTNNCGSGSGDFSPVTWEPSAAEAGGSGDITISEVVRDCTVSIYYRQALVGASVVGGNGSVSPSPLFVDAGDPATLTISPDAGYMVNRNDVTSSCEPGTFNAAGTEYFIPSINYNECYLNFRFVPVGSPTVSASVVSGSGTVEPAARTVLQGESASFELSPATGHQASTAVGGSCGAGTWSGNTYTVTSATADCSVEFSFTQQPTANHTITISANPAAAVSTISCTPSGAVAHGTSVTCNYLTQSGYQLDSVSDTAGACTELPCTFTAEADNTIVASFSTTTNVHTITPTFVNAQGALIQGGAIECTPNPVAHGERVVCTITQLPSDHVLEGIDGCTSNPAPNVCEIASVTGALSISARMRYVAAPASVVPVPVNAPLMLVLLAGLLGFAAHRSRKSRK